MRTDKPPVELVIRARNQLSGEQIKAITLAANLGASVTIYMDEVPANAMWKIAARRADYIEIAGRPFKDRSGQNDEFDKNAKVTNY